MKIAELRAKSKEELKDLIVSSKKEQFNLRMQIATGAEASPARLREVRKTVAQAKTLLSEPAVEAKKPAAKKKTAKAKKEA